MQRSYFGIPDIWWYLLGITFFAVHLVSSVGSQNRDRYPFQTYDNRKEGFVRDDRLVSSERLAFLSASIQDMGPQARSEPDSLEIVFYLPESSNVKISVMEVRELYLMEPLRRDYTDGYQSFIWPKKIVNDCSIDLNDLMLLGEIEHEKMNTIVPIMFVETITLDQNRFYSFCFRPESEVDSLRYSFYEYETNTRFFESVLEDLSGYDLITVNWNGVNDRNIPVIRGWYYLSLTVYFAPTIESLYGSRIVNNFRFYHEPDFMNLRLPITEEGSWKSTK